jgi:hypothetical protein
MLLQLHHHVDAKKAITFSSKIHLSKPISNHLSSLFPTWFERPQTPLQILQLNPGIEKIETAMMNEADSTTVMSAYLTPLSFPGLLVQSIVDFNVTFVGSTLCVSCNDNSRRQTFKGSKALASIVSKLTPTIRSSSVMKYDDTDQSLQNDVKLDIEFSVPGWFPFSASIVEVEGSKAVEKTLVADIDKLLCKVLTQFEEDTKLSFEPSPTTEASLPKVASA